MVNENKALILNFPQKIPKLLYFQYQRELNFLWLKFASCIFPLSNTTWPWLSNKELKIVLKFIYFENYHEGFSTF